MVGAEALFPLTRGIARVDYMKGNRASNGWHSDITFERVPSDYTVGTALSLGQPTKLTIYPLASQDAYASTRYFIY
jgi:hypothetical protein